MLHKVLKRPVITEKSVAEASTKNIYLFEVNPLANKHQVQAAVESTFGVTVEMVRTVKVPPKKKRTGKKRMTRIVPAKKKAFVHVKQGQKINAFDVVTQENK